MTLEQAFISILIGGLTILGIIKLFTPGTKNKLPDDPLNFKKGEVVYFSVTTVHKGKITAVQSSDDVTLGFQSPYTVKSRSFGKTLDFNASSIYRAHEAARRNPVIFL